jgi:hypothetical protein
MSLVSVHGPNMWGGAGAAGGGSGNTVQSTPPGGGTVTDDLSNGFKFTFAGLGNRAAADYDWSFSGGAGAAAQPNIQNGTVTFTDAGPKVITLTLGSSGGTTPAPGVYTFNVVATSAGPRMVEEQSSEPPPEPPPSGYDEEAYASYVLADHSIADVKDFLGHYDLTPENIDDLISEEENGANRVTLLDWLNTLRA